MNQGEKEWLPLLKGVSRSFYLSLRLLPGPMRSGAVTGYLLARASDTLADTEGVPVSGRLECLGAFREVLVTGGGELPAVGRYEEVVDSVGERVLLGRLPELFRVFRGLPDAERELVQEVVVTILEGQRLDLVRFGGASAAHPACLGSREELEDYAYRVAGCVGEFWTKLGYLTLGDGFSGEEPDLLCRWGREYGMGLQLVNILRDAPFDLAEGRCYLPVAAAGGSAAYGEEHRYWQDVARKWVGSGVNYSKRLVSRRLKIASGLPAAIAVETLDLIAAASWEALSARVKVSRGRVYAAIWRGLVSG